MSKDDWLFLLFLFLIVIMMIAASGAFFTSFAIYSIVAGIKRFYHKTKDKITSLLTKRDGEASYRKKIKQQFVNRVEIELGSFNSFIKGINVSLSCYSNDNDDLIVILTDDRYEESIMKIRIDFEKKSVTYSKDLVNEIYICDSSLRLSILAVLPIIREHLEDLFS